MTQRPAPFLVSCGEIPNRQRLGIDGKQDPVVGSERDFTCVWRSAQLKRASCSDGLPKAFRNRSKPKKLLRLLQGSLTGR